MSRMSTNILVDGPIFADRVFNSAPVGAFASYRAGQAVMRGRMQAETDDDEIERRIDETIRDEKKRGEKGDDDNDDEKGESAKDRARRIAGREKEIERLVNAVAGPRVKFVGKSRDEHASDWRRNAAKLRAEGYRNEAQYVAVQEQVDACLAHSK